MSKEIQYISVSEAAKILGVHQLTVRKYIKKGRLVSHKLRGFWVKLDKEEVENFGKIIKIEK